VKKKPRACSDLAISAVHAHDMRVKFVLFEIIDTGCAFTSRIHKYKATPITRKVSHGAGLPFVCLQTRNCHILQHEMNTIVIYSYTCVFLLGGNGPCCDSFHSQNARTGFQEWFHFAKLCGHEASLVFFSEQQSRTFPVMLSKPLLDIDTELGEQPTVEDMRGMQALLGEQAQGHPTKLRSSGASVSCIHSRICAFLV
jgi:hypothetical protein